MEYLLWISLESWGKKKKEGTRGLNDPVLTLFGWSLNLLGGKIHKKEIKDHDITQPFPPLRLLVCSMAKKYKEHCGLIEGLIRRFYSQVSTLTRGEWPWLKTKVAIQRIVNGRASNSCIGTEANTLALLPRKVWVQHISCRLMQFFAGLPLPTASWPATVDTPAALKGWWAEALLSYLFYWSQATPLKGSDMGV